MQAVSLRFGGLRAFDWRILGPRFALALALVVVVWPAFAHAAEVWRTDEEFNYGFLIPPMAAAITWWRRHELSRSVGPGRTAGLAIIVVALAMMLVSRRIGINVLAGVAVSPLFVGIAVYLWGWGAGRVLAFPSGFLVFGLGLYRGLLNSLGFALQEVTATGSAWLSSTLGLGVAREGLALYSTSPESPFAFVVAQACSGMNSLLSLLALAALWIYVTRGPLRGRAATMLSVLPLVVVANTARVTLVLFVASWWGQDAAIGFFHGLSSLVLFGLALGGLLVVSRILGCKLAPFVTSS